jgi:hypothetical protein
LAKSYFVCPRRHSGAEKSFFLSQFLRVAFAIVMSAEPWVQRAGCVGRSGSVG